MKWSIWKGMIWSCEKVVYEKDWFEIWSCEKVVYEMKRYEMERYEVVK